MSRKAASYGRGRLPPVASSEANSFVRKYSESSGGPTQPVVGAGRLQLFGESERLIADALECRAASRPPGQAAAALVAGLRLAEESAAGRMEQEGRELTDAEVTALLDDAVVFAAAGIAAIGQS